MESMEWKPVKPVNKASQWNQSIEPVSEAREPAAELSLSQKWAAKVQKCAIFFKNIENCKLLPSHLLRCVLGRSLRISTRVALARLIDYPLWRFWTHWKLDVCVFRPRRPLQTAGDCQWTFCVIACVKVYVIVSVLESVIAYVNSVCDRFRLHNEIVGIERLLPDFASFLKCSSAWD